MIEKTEKEIKLEILWKECKKIEDDGKCPYCKDYTLVHTNPFDYEFLCRKCGRYLYIKKLEECK